MTTGVIIGAGWVAQNCYLPAFKKLGISLGAAADISIEAAKRLTEQSGGLAVTTIEEALLQRPDICVIATPNFLHARQSLEALIYSGLVLCEKPLAVSLGELALLKTAVLDDRLHISTPNRFRPDVIALMTAIKRGNIGDPLRVKITWRRKSGIPRPGSWYTNTALSGGGALIDIGSHAIDCGMMLLGFPQCRSAHVLKAGLSDPDCPPGADWMPSRAQDGGCFDVECSGRGNFGLDAGKLLEVDVSWNAICGEDKTIIEVEGTAGCACLKTLFGYAPVNSFAPILTIWGKEGKRESVFSFTRSPAVDFGGMLGALLGQKNDGAPGPATFNEGIEVARMIMNGYQTAEFPWLAGLA